VGIEPHLENRPLSVRRIRDLHHHKDKTRVYSTRERMRGRERKGERRGRERNGSKEREEDKGD
jgi:hypothetical protein